MFYTDTSSMSTYRGDYHRKDVKGPNCQCSEVDATDDMHHPTVIKHRLSPYCIIYRYILNIW